MTLTASLGPSSEHSGVPIAAHHEPWSTAAAMLEGLGGEDPLHRAARRLRTGLNRGLRRWSPGEVPELEAWRERLRRVAPGVPLVLLHAQDIDPETAELLRTAGGIGHPVHCAFDRLPSGGPARHLADQVGLRAAAPAPNLPHTSPEVTWVLRAASFAGSPFQVRDVARRLEQPVAHVLAALQHAADVGVPIADHGNGTLSLPEAAREAWLAGLLPSVVQAWEQADAPHADAPKAVAPKAVAPKAVAPKATPPPPAEVAAPPPRPAAPPAGARPDPRQVLLDGRRLLQELGDSDAPEVRVQRGHVLLAMAQALRASPGLGTSLGPAIDHARHALDALEGLDANGSAEARLTLAHLLVEQGDPGALDEALELIVHTSRALADDGNALAAASLLNDQALVWLKLGDPVRATHLLQASLEAQQGFGDSLPARLEGAETHHLIARLPLYAASRDGMEDAALDSALEHLERAESAFREAGWADRLAHVFDTRGRLLTRRGRPEPALASLELAARMHRQHGDGLGLARTTEALAALWTAEGRVERAASLLEQSTVLNLAAASPLGLAYVRRAAERLPEGPAREALESRLAQAEAVVGTTSLPPIAGS